jgi:hypothetical protein
VHVITNRAQVTVATPIHDQSLVTPAEQVAKEFVPPIEPHGIGAQKPFHAGNQISQWRFQDQMKMISQQTQRMHLPTGPEASFPQRFQKPFPILVVFENRFPPIPAIHHMINRSGILHSQLAGHAVEIASANRE